MEAPKKALKALTDNDRWEILKSNAIAIDTILLHQANPVFTGTDRTINAMKPKFKGLQMWRTPTCYLLELKGKREIIEIASVFSSKPA